MSRERRGEKGMMEIVKNIGAISLFMSVYLPLVAAYMAGGFKEMADAFGVAFGSDSDAPALVKYGEASDY